MPGNFHTESFALISYLVAEDNDDHVYTNYLQGGVFHGDSDLSSTGFVAQIHHSEVGPTWLLGRPWCYSGAPGAAIKPAPCVGQHSREILCDELGISAAEYEELDAVAVIGTLDDF